MNKDNPDEKSKNIKKEKTVVEFLNGIVDKVQSFTDEKLDKLEEKLNEYTID